MIAPHLYKIKRTSNYDFLNRNTFLRLDRNERNFPFSKKIIKDLKKVITNYSLQSYPGNKKKLIDKIARFEKINLNCIEIVPGSDAALKYIFELFSFKRSSLSSIYPTYGMIDVYSKVYKTHLYKIKKYQNNLNYKDFFKKNIKWIYIANPNQPDGKIISVNNIIKIIKRAKKKNIIVVIDEAYFNFSKQASLIGLVKKFKNLVVL